MCSNFILYFIVMPYSSEKTLVQALCFTCSNCINIMDLETKDCLPRGKKRNIPANFIFCVFDLEFH